MRLRLIPLAPTMSRDTGAVRLFCSAREVQTHALSTRRTIFRTCCGPVRGPALNALALDTRSCHLEQGRGGNATVLQCSRNTDTRFARSAHSFQECCGPVRRPA